MSVRPLINHDLVYHSPHHVNVFHKSFPLPGVYMHRKMSGEVFLHLVDVGGTALRQVTDFL